MPLIYTVISRYPDIVLSEYSDYHGNFMQIAHVIIQNSIKYNKKYIITYDKFKIHYVNDKGITFLCLSEDMTDDDSFAFLLDVNRKLSKVNDVDLNSMSAYQLDYFKEELKSMMTYYNTHPLVTKAGESIYELNLSKEAVMENIENLIPISNKMDIIATKAEGSTSFTINNSNEVVENLRKSDTTRKNKYIIVSSVMIGLLILIFIFLSS